MKKILIPLLLVITMVSAASLASAQSNSWTGPYNAANGWDLSQNWAGNSPSGTNAAYATHAVTMDANASGRFSANVNFAINGFHNYVEVDIVSVTNKVVSLLFLNGKFAISQNYVSAENSNPAGTYDAQFSSEDGKTWHVDIGGYSKDLALNDVPAYIVLQARNNVGTEAAPVINSVTFVSEPKPVVPEVPDEPTEPVNTAPSVTAADARALQDFYTNIYPQIGSPYDTVTYNADGTYSVTKGYPVSDTHDVAGTVTSAADGSAIAGASVVLGDKLQKTDSAGKFKFEGVTNGAADIAVSADGFASKTQTVNVNADMTADFTLDKVATGGATTASAANETANTTTNVTAPVNTTANTTTMAPTTAPSATQTKSPGFEGIAAAIALIGAVGVLVYANRKH